MGAISHAEPDLVESVQDAQVVFVSTPVDAAIEVLRTIGPHCKADAVVSDVCSVKGPLHEAARTSLPANILYIGTHPMTGSEKSGIRHASGLLYENATCVVCGTDSIPDHFQARYRSFLELLSSTGANLFSLDALEHDRIAARVSHVPQLLAVLLVLHASAPQDAWRELAAGGFKDMTRIASSSWSIWKDILSANRGEIHHALSDLATRLDKLKSFLEVDDLEAVREMFHDAEQAREFIVDGRKGFLKPLADIYVFIADKPGVLAEITSTLARHELDIKDIELLRIRENAGGTFRLGFAEVSDAENAVRVLSRQGLTAYGL